MLVLDRAHFDHMTGADRALQLEVLGFFRMQIEAWRAAFGTGEGWRDAVHTMKGSARGIGLMALATACESAEEAADADTADALQSVQAHLRDALDALEQFAAEAS